MYKDSNQFNFSTNLKLYEYNMSLPFLKGHVLMGVFKWKNKYRRQFCTFKF